MEQQQDSFQAAIDYLIADRKKPVVSEQGIFTNPSTAPTTPISTPSSEIGGVTGGLFSSFLKKPSDSARFVGNPFTGTDGGSGGDGLPGTPSSGGLNIGGAPSFGDVAKGASVVGALQSNPQALSTIGGLLAGPFGAIAAKYGVPFLGDMYNEYQYDRALDDFDARAANVAAAQSMLGSQIGTYSDMEGRIGTISNQAMIDAYDRDIFGITGAEMDAARGANTGGGTNSDGTSGPGDSTGNSSGGGRGVDGW